MTTNLINELGEQMLKVSKDGCVKIHICYYDNTIAARCANHTIEPHPVFAIHYADEVQKGLNSRQWFALGDKVGEFLRSKS